MSEKKELLNRYKKALAEYDYYKGLDNIKYYDRLKALKGKLNVILTMCKSRGIYIGNLRRIKNESKTEKRHQKGKK